MKTQHKTAPAHTATDTPRKRCPKKCKRQSHLPFWHSLKMHMIVLIKPLIVGAAFAGLAFWTQSNDIHYSKKCSEMMTAGIIPSVVVLYAVLAALAITTIWSQYNEVVRSVKKDDVKSFLLLRDERIPVLLHILLAFFALSIVGLIVLYDWDGCVIEAAGATFIISFALGLYTFIAIELDNPCNSLWVEGRIPEEWIEMDISICKMTNGDAKGEEK